MHNQSLTIAMVQIPLKWEDAAANRNHIESLLSVHLNSQVDIILFPEMFTTGFSMNAEVLAETMSRETVQWMRAISSKYQAAVSGSLIIRENEHYYNRLIWVNEADNEISYYDKRHCFSLADENKHFTPGNAPLHLTYKNWKLGFYICYDLRFPEWIRDKNETEVLIFVANWPEKRKLAWKTLLMARAIENVAYVAGVNRTGQDGMDISYSGDSQLIAFDGNVMLNAENQDGIFIQTITKDPLIAFRRAYPFLKDQK